MNWAEAQQLVADGDADALIQINKTEERQKTYDFSSPLLDSKFSVFATRNSIGVHTTADLRGLRVGVEPKGFPEATLKSDPVMDLIVIPTILDGFRLLLDGKIDAVAVDEWVGEYILAVNMINEVQIIGEPISIVQSSIAVKKGNMDLLARINRALGNMRLDGSYSAIMNKWQTKKVVFRTREQIQKAALETTLAILALSLILSIVFLAILLRQRAERKRQYSRMKNSENLLSLVIDTSTNGIWIADTDGKTTKVNKVYCQMSGYSEEEIKSLGISKIAVFETKEELNDRQSPISTESSKHFESKHRCKNGEIKDVDVSINYLPADGGLIVSYIRDITESKKADGLIQDLLVEKDNLVARFNFATAAGGVGIWDYDISNNALVWDDQMYLLHGISAKQFGGAYEAWQSGLHPEDKAQDDNEYQMALRGEKQYNTEFRVIWPDGSVHFLRAKALVQNRDSKGIATRIIGTNWDITAHVLAHQKIDSLLKEKEMVLREVHHRIKNNMNTMKSLVYLQRISLSDSSAIDVLKDVENRFNSMSVLYDKLYQSQEFGSLSIQQYLSSLVDEIVHTFPNGKSIEVYKDIDDCVLGAKTLQTLGIIVNELITNIMKYAFGDGRKGIISITAKRIEGRLILSIKDNGVGMPENINFDNSTGFGLMLIKELTKQIDGAIRIEREKGTQVVLEFAKQ